MRSTLRHVPGFRLLAALLLAAAALAPAARATIYLNNLGAGLLDLAPINATTWGGQSFLTDNSAAAFALNSVTYSLGPGNVTGGGFTVSLFSDGPGDLPGTLLETLSGNASPDTAGNYTYTSTGTLLQPNTLYWAIAQVSPASSAQYNLEYTANETIAGSWTTIGWTYTQDSASTWFAPDLTEPDILSVSATPVPEPAATAGLVAFVALACAAVRRRHRRRTLSASPS